MEEKRRIRSIACIGGGFVGGITAAIIAYKTHASVTVIDTDSRRIAAWNSGNLPFDEPGLKDIVFSVRKTALDETFIANPRPHVESAHDGNQLGVEADLRREHPTSGCGELWFSSNVGSAITDADLILVCVDTPSKRSNTGEGSLLDLMFLKSAVKSIATNASTSKIVAIKSTVSCGTTQSVEKMLTANTSTNIRLIVLSNPEFMAQGSAISDLLEPDRIVIGSSMTEEGVQAAATLADLYAQWIPRASILTMNHASAELSKLASNALLAQRVTNANALSIISEGVGADVEDVTRVCGLDARIGPQMMRAGLGFGGKCFQKDNNALEHMCRALNLNTIANHWRSTTSLNAIQRDRFSRRVIAHIKTLQHVPTIALLGCAFKEGASDLTNSSFISLSESIWRSGGKIAVFDPQIPEISIWRALSRFATDIPDCLSRLEVCKNAYDACDLADTVVITTSWAEFGNRDQKATSTGPEHVVQPEDPGSTDSTSKGASRKLDWERIAVNMNPPKVVFDGWNILDPFKMEAYGVKVEGIGKGSPEKVKPYLDAQLV
ncbi:UDP-glucose 6-dehydrogenase 1 [Agyrium rufum]|nr:UDP-glucose 6-dehydrogenase 1 [Agyrium rufum]